MGYGRYRDQYYDEPDFEAEHYQRDVDYPLERRDSRQEKEDELVARALERIARARALGKTNVKLSQPEIDALERLERSKPQQKSPQPPKAPASKKAGTRKAIEASKKKRSDSPKSKSVEGRARNRSNASTRSARDDDLVSYPVPRDPDYEYVGRPGHEPYQGSPLRPGGSRSNSYSNMRGAGGPPPMYAPYYQNQRFVSMPEGPYHRRGDSTAARVRADSSRSDQSSRSRSNSHLRNMPLDQLPNPNQQARAPRFDPSDPRFGSPSRRVVSGPPYGAPMSRRQSDEMFLHVPPDDAEVQHYMVSSSSRSSSDSDGSYNGVPVDVDVTERPGTRTGYGIKTRSAAAASGTAKRSKSGAKAAVRRR